MQMGMELTNIAHWWSFNEAHDLTKLTVTMIPMEDCVVPDCTEGLEERASCSTCDSNNDDCSSDKQLLYCTSGLNSNLQQFQNSNIKKVLWRIFYKKRSIIIPFFWGILVGVTMTAVLFQQHVLHQTSFLESADSYSPIITNQNIDRRRGMISEDFISKLMTGTTASSLTTADKVNQIHKIYQ